MDETQIHNSLHFIGSEINIESLYLRRGCKNGDVALTNDTGKCYVYADGEWIPFENDIHGSGTGLELSLYEINQNIMGQLPAMKAEDIAAMKRDITYTFTDAKYYMLLCNELHYYTIFVHQAEDKEFDTLGQGVVELFKEMNAEIISYEDTEQAFEIWAKMEDDTTHVFLLFPYDRGVVYYG